MLRCFLLLFKNLTIIQACFFSMKKKGAFLRKNVRKSLQNRIFPAKINRQTQMNVIYF